MEYLTSVIEKAAQQAGDQKRLETALGLAKGYLTEVKAGRRGLPVAVCYALAEMIGEDERRVVAASELITEKKAERRAVLLPFVAHALTVIFATVILFVTPSPVKAAPVLQVPDLTVYIM